MSILTKPLANSSVGLLLLRLVLGIVFFAHGAQKVLGWFGGYGLSATIQLFQQKLSIPPVLAYLSAFTEFLGGIALVFGFLSRIFSIGIAINMLVAIFLVHLTQGLFNPNGFEYPLSLLVMSLVVFLAGPGAYSLDAKLFAEKEKTSPEVGNLKNVAIKFMA